MGAKHKDYEEEVILEELLTRQFIKKYSDNTHGFIHKKWQTYFAALYFKNNLNFILKNIKDYVEYGR